MIYAIQFEFLTISGLLAVVFILKQILHTVAISHLLVSVRSECKTDVDVQDFRYGLCIETF
jgi:hypothetical protein